MAVVLGVTAMHSVRVVCMAMRVQGIPVRLGVDLAEVVLEAARMALPVLLLWRERRRTKEAQVLEEWVKVAPTREEVPGPVPRVQVAPEAVLVALVASRDRVGRCARPRVPHQRGRSNICLP